jgi:hypothetical protein
VAQQSKQTGSPPSIYQPANWDQHQQDLAERQAKRDKNRARLRACLDPDTAKRYEDRKPVYEWRVECTWHQPNREGGGLEVKSATHQIVAQDEKIAFAMFCDKVQAWPGRKNCEVTITRLEKRTLDGDAG